MFVTARSAGETFNKKSSSFQQTFNRLKIPSYEIDNFSKHFATVRSKDLKWRRGGNKDKKAINDDPKEDCPSIRSADSFTERKSIFQGHAATVTNVSQIKLVLKKLYENRKIAQATHNIYAYRIYNQQANMWLEDYDDDGETHAGERLIHLLQVLDAKDVIVVVSRWFGGILLGGDRFKYIQQAARNALDLGNHVASSNNNQPSDKKNRKKK